MADFEHTADAPPMTVAAIALVDVSGEVFLVDCLAVDPLIVSPGPGFVVRVPFSLLIIAAEG